MGYKHTEKKGLEWIQFHACKLVTKMSVLLVVFCIQDELCLSSLDDFDKPVFCCFVDAYETAKMLCEQYYLVAPDLEVEEFNGNFEINLISDVSKKKHF